MASIEELVVTGAGASVVGVFENVGDAVSILVPVGLNVVDESA